MKRAGESNGKENVAPRTTKRSKLLEWMTTAQKKKLEEDGDGDDDVVVLEDLPATSSTGRPKRSARRCLFGTHKGRNLAAVASKRGKETEEAAGEAYHVVVDGAGKSYAVMRSLREQDLPVLDRQTVDDVLTHWPPVEREGGTTGAWSQDSVVEDPQDVEQGLEVIVQEEGEEENPEKSGEDGGEEEDAVEVDDEIDLDETSGEEEEEEEEEEEGFSSTVSQTGGSGGRPLVVLGAVSSRYNKVFCVDQHSVGVVFSRDLERDPERLFPLAVEEAVQEARRLLPPQVDRPSHVAVSLDVDGSALTFHSGLVALERFDGNRLAEAISRAAQSEKAHLVVGKKAALNVSYLRLPSANGTLHGAIGGDKKNITLVEGDRLCLVKAVVLGAAYVDMLNAPEGTQRRIKKNAYNNMVKRPSALASKVDAFMKRHRYTKQRGYGIADVDMMQKFLGSEYRIVCFQDIANTEPVYDYHIGPADRVIGLRYKEEIGGGHGHFDHIKKVARWVGRSYYCFGCKKGYNNRTDHMDCPYRCVHCGEYGSKQCAGDEDLLCGVCEERFPSERCMSNHLEVSSAGHSMCSLKTRCPKCRQWDLSGRTGIEHKCHHTFCKRCSAQRPPSHTCTVAPLRMKKVKNQKFTIFDMESTLVDVVRPDGTVMKEHKPNLIMALKCCTKCMDVSPGGLNDPLPPCSAGVCGERFKVYSQLDHPTMDVVEAFVSDLVRPENSDRTIIAHNLSGYDGQFILREIERQKHLYCEKLVLNGRKIIKAELYNKSVLLDTLHYWQQPLAKCSQTFNLTELKKGHFPHRLNVPSFYDYVGDLPALENYADSLFHTSKQVKEITAWWREEDARMRAAGEQWSFKTSLYEYCYSDTKLLYESVLAFRRSFMAITGGVEVFAVSSTAASAAMATFRTNHLTPDTIAISDPPQHRAIQSVKAAKYFSWYNHQAAARGEPVARFALTPGGEHQVPGTKYKVDGFVERTDGQRPLAIEFQGCYYHACGCKYSALSIVREDANGRPVYAHAIRARDNARAECIRELYDYAIVRECDVDVEIRQNSEMAAFFDSCEIQSPLHVRDALFGGRTEAFTLYRAGIISYLDFCSLYPFTNKNCRYPVGAPTRTVTDRVKCPITDPAQIETDGFLKCKVLPPARLFLPVLPFRPPDRASLLFGLCRTCMREQKTGFCRHTDAERSFWGTWATDELKLAVARGYTVIDVHEGLHYDTWKQYNKETGEHGPLSSYIDCFLRVKQESSGLPPGVATEAEIDAYIERYREQEGIQLVRENIKYNPGERAGSKLLLNSLWGKLGENPDKPHTVHLTSAGDFWALIGNGSNVVHNINFISDNKIIVQYRKAAEELLPSHTSSEAYAALTTAYARIRLYEALEKIAEADLLYADTDSAQFEVRDGEANPLQDMIGEFLGDLTSEIPEGWTETEFAAAGPKNYAYRCTNSAGEEKTEVKCRGFKLTDEASKKITFDEVKRRADALAEGRDLPPLDVHYSLIRPDGTHRVFTVPTTKRYRAVFNKRMIGLVPEDKYRTLPWGYKQCMIFRRCSVV